MPGFSLRARLDAGDQIFAAWIASGRPRSAEATVQVGFDAAIFDLQHGEGDFAGARDGIAAVRAQGKPSGIRAGLDAYGEAAHLLDVGAELAIMPMINGVDDARRLVGTLKYPPVGGRSWGPTRAIDVLGMTAATYRAEANANIIVLAMVETRPAVDALEAILDIPGLDGVFIGPSDLSISLTDGAVLDHRLPEAVTVMERLVAAARERKKISAIFCAGGEAARRNADMGFDILAVGADTSFLIDGARAALTAARGSAGEGGARY